MFPSMLTFSIVLPAEHPDVVLVSVLVAFRTVTVIADALLDMFAADIFLRVFVAAIAGIATVVVTHMAGCAFHIVVAVQFEILCVNVVVALTAIACDLLVQYSRFFERRSHRSSFGRGLSLRRTICSSCVFF